MFDDLYPFFAPEIITPEQFADINQRRPNSDANPLLRLQFAVLFDAINLLARSGAHAEKPKLAPNTQRLDRDAREAVDWLLDAEAEGPFAVRTICEMLDANYQRLRERVSQWLITPRELRYSFRLGGGSGHRNKIVAPRKRHRRTQSNRLPAVLAAETQGKT